MPIKVVDRVVWAKGLGRSATTSILPSLLDAGDLLSWRPLDRITEAAIGPTGDVLMETLVDLQTLAAIDADAAAAVAAAAPNAKHIWYRRVIGPDVAHDAPRWMAIDASTGEVLGTAE